MTNAFMRGLRRLFGVGKKSKKAHPMEYKPAELDEIALQVEGKALDVTSQEKVAKKATKKKTSKKKASKKKATSKKTTKKKSTAKKTSKKSGSKKKSTSKKK